MQQNFKNFKQKQQIQTSQSPRKNNFNNSKIIKNLNDEENQSNIFNSMFKVDEQENDSSRPLELPHAAGLFATLNKQVQEQIKKEQQLEKQLEEEEIIINFDDDNTNKKKKLQRTRQQEIIYQIKKFWSQFKKTVGLNKLFKKNKKKKKNQDQQQQQQQQDDSLSDISDEDNIENENKKNKKIKGELLQVMFDVYVDCLKGEQIEDTMSLAFNKYFNQYEPGCKNFITENDYSVGDIILKFPNPDHQKIQDKIGNKSMGKKEAIKYFKKTVQAFDHNSQMEQADIDILKQAFLQIYDSLSTNHSEREKKIIQILEKKIKAMKKYERIKKRELYEEDDPQNPEFKLKKIKQRNHGKIITGGKFFVEKIQQIDLLKEYEIYDNQQMQEEEGGKMTFLQMFKKRQKEEGAFKWSKEGTPSKAKNGSPSKARNGSPSKKQNTHLFLKKNIGSPQVSKQGTPSVRNSPSIKKHGDKSQQKSLFSNFIKKNKNATPSSKMNMSNSRPNDRSVDRSNNKSMIAEQNTKDYIYKKSDWLRTSKNTQDFMTLQRHLIWLRLVKIGFNMRHFLSQDGQYFYTVLYCNDENLQITAIKDKMKKSMTIEMSDIFSLEPVDKRLRPFRLNSKLWNNQEIDTFSLKFKYLRERIKELINEINFKKIAKECNVMHLNSCQLKYGEQESLEEDTPTDKQWELYMEYLLFLKERISKLRKQYRYKSTNSHLINKLVEPYGKFHFNRMSIEAKLLRKKLRRMQERGKDEPDTDDSLSDISISSEEYEEIKEKFQFQDQRQLEENVFTETELVSQNNLGHQLSAKELSQNEFLQKELLFQQTIQENIEGEEQEEQEIQKTKNDKKNLAIKQNISTNNDNTQTLITDQSEIKELLTDRINQITLRRKNSLTKDDQLDLSQALQLGNIQTRKNKLLTSLHSSDFQSQQEIEQVQQQQQKATLNLKTLQNNFNDNDTSQDSQDNDDNDMDNDDDNGQNKKKQSMLNLSQDIQQPKKKKIKIYLTEEQKKELKREHDIKYRSLIAQLNLKSSKALHSKIIKLRKQQILSNEYKKVFTEALKVVNLPFKPKKVLQSVWDYLEQEPFETHVKYFHNPANISFKKNVKCHSIWKNYQITESGRLSLFSSMERLKLAFSTLQKTIDINFLQENGMITNIFAINDEFELLGKSHKFLFKPFLSQNIEKENLQQGVKQVQILNQIQNYKKMSLLAQQEVNNPFTKNKPQYILNKKIEKNKEKMKEQERLKHVKDKNAVKKQKQIREIQQENKEMEETVSIRKQSILINLNQNNTKLIPSRQSKTTKIKGTGKKHIFLESDQIFKKVRTQIDESVNDQSSQYQNRESLMISNVQDKKDSFQNKSSQYNTFKSQSTFQDKKLSIDDDKKLDAQINNKRYSILRPSIQHLRNSSIHHNLQMQHESQYDDQKAQQSLKHNHSNILPQYLQDTQQQVNNTTQQFEKQQLNLFSKNTQQIKGPVYRQQYILMQQLKQQKIEFQKIQYKHQQQHVIQDTQPIIFTQKAIEEDTKFQKQLITFAEKKIRNINFIWKFSITTPWYVPTEEVRSYYGEKIAIYFTFLAYYDKRLISIGLLGIIVFIFQSSFDKKSVTYVVFTVIFGCLQMMWVATYMNSWRQKETIFALKFGQQSGKSVINADEEDHQERPGFVGEYQRSLIDNELNHIYYPSFERNKQYIINYTIVVFGILVYSFAVIGIMLLQEALYQQVYNMPRFFVAIKIEIILPSTLNYILIKLIEGYQLSISKYLTDKENHESIKTYEMNYITKRFIFSFVNLVFPIYTLLFFNELLSIQCSEYCYKNAQIYYANTFILLFIEKIREPVAPIIKVWFKNYQKKRILQKQNINTFLQDKDFMEHINNKFSIQKEQKMNQKNPFLNIKSYEKINQFIEKESEKKKFSESNDIYGTVDEFMEIALQYAYANLFGLLFPIVYIIAFIWITAELQTDKIKLMKYIQRPFPQNESSIGIWIQIYDFICILSIITNSALITQNIDWFYEQEIILPDGELISSYKENTIGFLSYFLIFTSFNFGLRLIVEGFGFIPYTLVEIISRQQYLIQNTILVFKKNSNWKNNSKKKKDQQDWVQAQFQANKNYIQQFLVREKLKDLSYLSQTSSLPIYKIFKTFYKRKRPQFQIEEEEDVYEDMDSSEESGSENELDLENIDMQQITKKHQRAQPKKFKKKKKKEHKLWQDSKIINHQMFINRPLIIRKMYMRRKDIYEKMAVIKLNMEYENENLLITDFEDRIEKNVRKTFGFGLKGVSFHQFRRKDQYMSLRTLTNIIISQNLKGQLNIEDQNQQQEEIEVENNVIKNQNIILGQKKKFIPFDINEIQFNEIEKYFAPKGKTKLVDISLLREEKWSKVLDNKLSIQVKKLLFNKYEQELLVFSQQDQLFCEQLSFRQLRNYALVECQISHQNFLLLHKITRIVHSEQKWLYKMKKKPKGEENIFNLDQAFSTRVKMTSEEESRQQNLIGHSFMSFLIIQNGYTLHLKILQDIEKVNNIIWETHKDDICKVKFSLLNGEDQFSFSERNLGYYARFYEDHYICSIQDIIRSRKDRNFYYSDTEALFFLEWLVKMSVQFESQQTYHMAMIPDNIILAEENFRKYRLCGAGMAVYCDTQQDQYYFCRTIYSDESYFFPPEIIDAYMSKEHKIKYPPIKSQMYQIMAFMIYFMTLGQVQKDLKNYKQNLVQYVQDNNLKLMEKYPVAFSISKDIIVNSDPNQRYSPQQILRKIINNTKTDVREHDFLIIRKRNRRTTLLKKHTQYYYTGSLNHFLFLTRTYQQLQIHNQCLKLINQMLKSVKNVLIKNWLKSGKQSSKSYLQTPKSTYQHFNQIEEEEEEEDDDIFESSSMSSSISSQRSKTTSQSKNTSQYGEQSFLSISSNQSPQSLQACTIQLYIIAIQSLLALAKYKEAEDLLKEVQDFLDHGMNEIIKLQGITKSNYDLQKKTAQKIAQMSPIIPIKKTFNENLQQKQQIKPPKIINLEDLNNSDQLTTNRSNLITVQEDTGSNSGNQQLLSTRREFLDNQELFDQQDKLKEVESPMTSSATSLNSQFSDQKNQNNEDINSNNQENSQEESYKSSKSQQQQLNDNKFKESLKIDLTQIQKQDQYLTQKTRVFSITDLQQQQQFQKGSFKNDKIDNYKKQKQYQFDDDKSKNKKNTYQRQNQMVIFQDQDKNNEDFDKESLQLSINTNDKKNIDKQSNQTSQFSLGNIISQYKNKTLNSLQSKKKIDSSKSSSSSSSNSGSGSGSDSDSGTSISNNLLNNQINSSSQSQSGNRSRSGSKNQQSLNSSNNSESLQSLSQNPSQRSVSSNKKKRKNNKKKQLNQSISSQNSYTSSNSYFSQGTSVSFRQKLEHFNLNVLYLKTYSLFLQSTQGHTKKSQKQSSQMLQIIKSRLVKKGSKYGYMTSSYKNCIRLLNTIKLEILFLLDTNQNHSAYNLAGYGMECIKLKGKTYQLCRERVTDSQLQPFYQDFVQYQVQTHIYQLQHGQTLEKIQKLIQNFNHISYCCFSLKKQMLFRIIQLDIVLYQNIDSQYRYLYPIFRQLLAISTNSCLQFMIFTLEIYEKSIQIIEFDGFKSEIVINLLDKIENIVLVQLGGNFYTNFLLGRFSLMLQTIKEKKRAKSLLQVAYGQLDIVQDQFESQVILLKERILENIIFLSNNENVIKERFRELQVIQNRRPQRIEPSLLEEDGKELFLKSQKNNKTVQKQTMVERMIRLRFFKGHFQEACELIIEQQYQMDEQVKHQVKKIKKYKNVTGQESQVLRDSLLELKIERLKFLDWGILINFMIGNYELIGDDLYEVMKFSYEHQIIMTLMFQIAINYKIFGLYKNAGISLQICEKYIYYMQAKGYQRWFFNREVKYIQALFYLEENKIDTKLTENKLDLESLQQSIDDRFKTIKHFEDILVEYPTDDNTDIMEILAILYEEDGQPVWSYHYYKQIIIGRQKQIESLGEYELKFIKDSKQLSLIVLQCKYALLKIELSELQGAIKLFQDLDDQLKIFLEVNLHYLVQKHTKIQYNSMKYLQIFIKCKLMECYLLLGKINNVDKIFHFLLVEFENMRSIVKHTKQRSQIQPYIHLYISIVAKSISFFYQSHFEYNYAGDYIQASTQSYDNYLIQMQAQDFSDDDQISQTSSISDSDSDLTSSSSSESQKQENKNEFGEIQEESSEDENSKSINNSKNNLSNNSKETEQEKDEDVQVQVEQRIKELQKRKKKEIKHVEVPKSQIEDKIKQKFSTETNKKRQSDRIQKKYSITKGRLSQIDSEKRKSSLKIGNKRMSINSLMNMTRQKRNSIFRKTSVSMEVNNITDRKSLFQIQARLSTQEFQYSKFQNTEDIIDNNDIYNYLNDILDFDVYKIELELQKTEIQSFNVNNLVQKYFGINDQKKQIQETKGLHSIIYAKLLILKGKIGMGVIEFKAFQEIKENYRIQNLQKLDKITDHFDNLENVFNKNKDIEQQQNLKKQKLNLLVKLKDIDENKLFFDLEKFFLEIESSIHYAKTLLTKFYVTENVKLNKSYDFSKNLLFAKADLINSSIQFYKLSVFQGRKSYLNTFNIYHKIFHANLIHPQLADFYHFVSPFFDQQVEIQKMLIEKILQIQKQDFPQKNQEILGFADNQFEKQKKKKNQNFDIIDFKEDLIYEMTRYNEQLHNILDEHKDFQEILVQQLQEFYIDYQEYKKQGILQKKYTYIDVQDNIFIDQLDNIEEEEQQENNQKDQNKQQIFKQQIDNNQNQKKEKFINAHEEFIKNQKRIKYDQKQKEIKNAQSQREHIRQLCQTKPLRDYIIKYHQQKEFTDKQLSEIQYSCQVDINIDNGEDFFVQSVKYNQPQSVKVLCKALMICKFLWDKKDVHKNNYLYKTIQNKYLMESNEIHLGMEDQNIKEEYMRPIKDSPSPKANNKNLFNFEDSVVE